MSGVDTGRICSAVAVFFWRECRLSEVAVQVRSELSEAFAEAVFGSREDARQGVRLFSNQSSSRGLRVIYLAQMMSR